MRNMGRQTSEEKRARTESSSKKMQGTENISYFIAMKMFCLYAQPPISLSVYNVLYINVFE